MLIREAKNWVSNLCVYVFENESIESNKIHELCKEYLVLRDKYSNNLTDLIRIIKIEIYKDQSALNYFNNDFKKLKKEIRDLFDIENQSLNIESTSNVFKKNLLSKLWKSKIIKNDHVTFYPSKILYDSGYADWDYVKGYFNNNIKNHQLKEALGWIVSFIESEDYNLDTMLIKNEKGQIKKEESFKNLINKINEKSLTNKVPFFYKNNKLYYNHSANEEINIKLWNESKQVIYGGCATTIRDYSERAKVLKNWLFIVKENAIIKKIKEIRNNENNLATKDIKIFLNMRLYKELEDKYFDNKILSNDFNKSLSILRKMLSESKKGFLIKEKEISKIELLEMSKLFLNDEKILIYFGDILKKESLDKNLLASMFVKGLNFIIKQTSNINVEEKGVDFILNNIKFLFNNVDNRINLIQSEKFLYNFLLNKNCETTIKMLSEKNVYSEERKVFFINLCYLFDLLKEDVSGGINKFFKNINSFDKEILIEKIKKEIFYQDLLSNIENINLSQHENTIEKKLLIEKIYFIGGNYSKKILNQYFINDKNNKIDLSDYEKFKKWCDTFTKEILLGDEASKEILEVLIDEFINNKYNPKYAVDYLKTKETVLKNFGDVKIAEKELTKIFLKLKKLDFTEIDEYSILHRHEIFNFREQKIFKSKVNRLSNWDFVKQYFDQKVSLSLIKEATGWVKGFLENGNYSSNDFLKERDDHKNFIEIIKKINKESLTAIEPFVIKENRVFFNPASAGEVDVEFFNEKTKKIYGMSITRHQGVSIEGNQFFRHALKLMVKSIIFEKEGVLDKDFNEIKKFNVDNFVLSKYINKNRLSGDVFEEILNGNEFAKNLSIIREYIREKYQINLHENKKSLSDEEVGIIIDEMKQKVEFSFFGEIRKKSKFKEVNAGMNNIAYIQNIKTIGDFEMSNKSASLFMDSINKDYNDLENNKIVNDIALKVVYLTLFEDQNISKELLEYFSEPNLYKEERESLFQTLETFLEIIKENYNGCDYSIEIGINEFFKNNINEEEKNKIKNTLKDGSLASLIEKKLKNILLSHSEDLSRVNLLLEKCFNIENFINRTNCGEKEKLSRSVNLSLKNIK